MKALEQFMQKMKPKADGKFPLAHAVWDGTYTFLFVPGHTNHNGTHIRDSIDLKRTMIMVVLALIPSLLFGIYNVGHQHFLAIGEMAEFMDKFLYGALKVLPIVIISYGVGLGVEFVFAAINKHAIQEGFLVSGMLIPLIMPVDVPLWMVAVATIFAVVIGKEVFGGTGMNVVNVALVARAFLFFAYPTKMSGDKVWISLGDGTAVDGFSGATPLGKAVEGGVEAIPSIMDSIIGLIPGSIGETSVIAIGLGALILILTGIGSFRIMLSMFVGGLLTGLVFNAVGGNPYLEVPALHQLMLGGFAFGAVFMATDPVTASQTAKGKIVYGLLIGIIAMLIRVANPAYPEGVMLAILIGNVFAPLIDHVVVNANIKKRLKRVKIA
ncbi:NADH:ubiquinone reductase (Na(+)-transporting) subunit B [Vicingus serpentipes]|jgi:Na+-transporting NADH:ubiquinone oxidoreductase subunit B|uniref:Na(+)-translocating NADH-quinone reductase subunit B n=1 Tax=Vicingus serpentipes TaxID=1926625 RepID=A0A5C6RWK5_9FLAO|nr:NADH:ubiquinone reductase (Na(+)-transporting) subunit B [Vicingus serpentipes]TXB65762.1 NADH:ubiquinone reductase (Na(+)-transporting) subunit B [Vicingus serpentipes]